MPKRTDPVIISTAQLAGILSLTERRVQQLREAGMPRVQHGKWDLQSVMPWYLEHIHAQANPHDKTAEDARRRWELARANLTEHKVAESKGQSLSLAEHGAIISEMLATLAGDIESFPVREYTNPDDRAIASKVCTRLRTSLAVAASGMGRRAKRSGTTAAAAADEERESMGGEEPDAAQA